MPPTQVSAVVLSAAVDAEPAMKRRRVKGLLISMRPPRTFGLGVKYDHFSPMYSC